MVDSTWGPRDATKPVEKSLLLGLFQGLAEGRTEALERLYDCCAEELYGLALWRTGSRADAADVLHDVFVKVAEVRHRLKKVGDPLAYMRRMTHRASIDVHRKRSRRREDPVDDCVYLEAGSASAERELEARRVSTLLEQLPPQQREAVYLHHFCGCSHADVGRATGVPTFTAASRYRLGIKKLRVLLGVEG